MDTKTIGAIFLVTGTSIGAGMLALPVSSAEAGFYPSMLAMLVTWAIMLLAAFCMLEVTLQCPPGSNMLTMAEQSLGKVVAAITWCVYIALLYALTTAYLTSLQEMIDLFIKTVSTLAPHPFLTILIMTCLFLLILQAGTKKIDMTNRVFSLGLAVAFLGVLFLLLPSTNLALLQDSNLGHTWYELNLFMVAFGYQIIIPSLSTYLKQDATKLKQALFWGSLIPLITYILWQFMIMGHIPKLETHGLLWIADRGRPSTDIPMVLSLSTNLSYIKPFMHVLSFCMIMTSFIGVTLALFDFLVDSTNHINTSHIHPHVKTVFHAALTLFPPLIIIYVNPHLFIQALQYGGICVSLLLVILPASMAMACRTNTSLPPPPFMTPGSWLTPVLVVCFGLLTLAVEWHIIV